jgi:hypothetical protein
MDTNEKLRALMQEMDEAQLGALAADVTAALDGRRKRIAVEDITIERLKDPQFKAEVRAELDAALKGLR